MSGKKKETNPFYSSRAWRRLRAEALRRDEHKCVWCRQAGRYAVDRAGRRVSVVATVVHHKIPIEERMDLALCFDNLVSLCDSCHDAAHPEKHAAMHKRRETIPAAARGIRIERL